MGKPLDKKLGLYVNLAALVSLIATILAIYFFVGSLNANARQTDRQLLAQSLVAAAEQNEFWAADYGWWSVALNYFNDGDTDALAASMAAPIQDHAGFDFVILAQEPQQRVYGWDRTTGMTVRDDIIEPAGLAAIREDLAEQYAAGNFLASHFLQIGDRTYIASATVLGEYADRAGTDPAADALLIIGKEMNAAFFASIEQHYLVNGIRFMPADAPSIDGAEPVRDAHGHQVGEIVWAPSLPGFNTLRVVFLPLIAYSLIFLIASQLIGLRARRLARQAEANEQRAHQAAATDNLSGLPNRHGFAQFISSDIAIEAARNGQAAAIYIDLNGFKAINDKAGHQTGDLAIIETARRFRAALPSDAYLARMGGDEFACILLGEESGMPTLEIARTLLFSLHAPVICDGRSFELGAAVGISESRPDAVKDFATMIDEADLAMYRAKSDGLDHPLYYDSEFAVMDGERRALDADMEAGLERDEFHVVYQPIVNARTGETVSLEALLRWQHPVRGDISPEVFIPAAEHSKLIHRLGDLVLDTVCEEFDHAPGVTVSINLSPTQLNDPDLCSRFLARLKEHGLTPARIELELTESVLIENFERAKARMDELSQAGFRFNLDDFGTGFASVSYLHTLPFSKIKIDKSFIDPVGRSENANKMLQAISLMSDAMQLETVAEGVETEAQASLLRLLGFNYMQGWYFGRPATAAARAQQDTPDTEPAARGAAAGG
ncbi:putative bifunctional diguanylate cyclase/phosphodiesterase [Maricaulis sp.]|uniref:putative bifunctional diguanylate cyclase/phosphodiesterase n=1 Tax=Maricaulis sp. TaxID=1486257 RepID=UPI003A945C0C